MPSYARKHQLQQSLVYHAFSRSSGRKVIFQESKDFDHFKALLCEYSDRFDSKIYHWVIMPNHYHLVVEFECPELISKFMAGLHRAYSHYYHKQYNAVGFLWQGRFKLQPIQKELYLKNCGRYVERNPLRAGMVREVFEYAHSSARFYCLGEKDGITQVSPDFEDFGKSAVGRQATYKEFLRAFDSKEEAYFSNIEIPCGDQDFLRRLVKTGTHYFPRRQGRKAAIFVS
ncbi:MAG: transposase [Candidatus Omnitrophica bacterium]|nr:transposase [Candidatus Omnitrophota bacterium]